MEIDRRQALIGLGSLAAGVIAAGCSRAEPHSQPRTTTSLEPEPLTTETDQPAASTTTTDPSRATPLVKKLDHLYVVLEEPEAAMGFMHDNLGLPVAWPFADYPGFASGGIGLGNLNLEFIKVSGAFGVEHPAQITGVSFEPSVEVDDAYVAELDRRRIARGNPLPGPTFSNISFSDVGGSDVRVFATRYTIPAAVDENLRQRALADVGGGKLAILRASELVIGTTDLVAARGLWQPLLAPVLPGVSRGRDVAWTLGSGPAIRLVAHHEDAVLELVLDTGASAAADTLASLRHRPDPLAGLPLTLRRA